MSHSNLAVRPSTLQSRRAARKWDAAIPPLLRPLFRAYLLGYASVVVPEVLSLLARILTQRRRSRSQVQRVPARHVRDLPSFVKSVRQILDDELRWQRFSAFCAALVGGSTLLEPVLERVLDHFARKFSGVARKRLSRWCASFLAAWLSLQLLQSRQSASFTEIVPVASDSPPGVKSKTVRYAGRTLDLSLFAATRALDVVVGEFWSRHQRRRRVAGKWTAVEEAVSRLVDPAVFALSSGLIMWAWVYHPARLPRTYNKWIGSAAAVDSRLTEALCRCRSGQLQYGVETGQAPLLQGICTDYGWPLHWGDPTVAIPFPCEMVHLGCGPSCETHAISRFARSFRWALRTYLPLNLVLLARSPNRKGVIRALLSTVRSSAFLGAFITMFYYGVCLARTRVGPHVLGKSTAARQAIDSGICVGAGCLLCGWSILIENASRRKDLALFVAPRALATLFPRRYAWDKQWRETLVFAASTAVVFTCVLENKRRVRGVLGNVLAMVLEP